MVRMGNSHFFGATVSLFAVQVAQLTPLRLFHKFYLMLGLEGYFLR